MSEKLRTTIITSVLLTLIETPVAALCGLIIGYANAPEKVADVPQLKINTESLPVGTSLEIKDGVLYIRPTKEDIITPKTSSINYDNKKKIWRILCERTR